MLAPAQRVFDAFFDLLGLNRPVDIIDIGSNPIVGSEAPYKQMLRDGLCSVMGFEPQAQALEVLKAVAGPNETYLPNVIGSGAAGELRVCYAPGLTGLLEPDPERLALLNRHMDFGRVVERIAVETARLDDIDAPMDYLKIDVQGGELDVFRSGVEKIKGASVIQTEVSMFRVYVGQPSFADIDIYLRSLGFVLHCFVDLKRWPISPAVIDGNPTAPLRQVVEADVVYVRDWTREMTAAQWRTMAAVMHHVYQSYDIALRCVIALAGMGELPEDAPERYAQLLRGKV